VREYTVNGDFINLPLRGKQEHLLLPY